MNNDAICRPQQAVAPTSSNKQEGRKSSSALQGDCSPTHQPLRASRDIFFDKNGNIRTKNISSYQLPGLTLTEEIGGTIYTVTGSYEGVQSFVCKLTRIIKRNSQSLGDSDDKRTKI